MRSTQSPFLSLGSARLGAAAFVLVGAACVAMLAPGQSIAQDSSKTYSAADQGYAIGFDLGRDIAAQIKADGVNADQAALIKGFTDAIQGRTSSMDAVKMETVLTGIHRQVAEVAAREKYQNDPVFRALADQNKQSGDAFRAAFARRDGAVTLPSGVITSVIREGTGERVGDANMVVANFVAMLTDGTEFARGRGQEFKVATLLPGAQDFVRNMKVGERAYVAIPPERAHGLAGKEGEIGPNETVVLDVEIVEVER
jgi:FKBP-type peptidyl-prolyl cis-trans isomerase